MPLPPCHGLQLARPVSRRAPVRGATLGVTSSLTAHPAPYLTRRHAMSADVAEEALAVAKHMGEAVGGPHPLSLLQRSPHGRADGRQRAARRADAKVVRQRP
jgi:hypothetical protein